MKGSQNLTHISFFLLLALSVLLPTTVYGIEEESPCMECHDDLYEESMDKMYIHSPFQKKNCEICHDAAVTGSGNDTGSQESGGPKISWLTKGGRALPEHWFLLPVQEGLAEFMLGVNGTGNKHRKLTYALPPFDDLPEINNDEKGPTIEGVKILSLQRSIFITATIGWDTDEISDAQIRYSLKKDKFQSAVDSQLSTSHQLTLMGLKPKKKYAFTVVSKDIFGNEAELGPFLLNTKKAKSGSGKSTGKADTNGEEEKEEEEEFTTEFFKTGSSYLVKVAANAEYQLFLGLNEGGDEDGEENDDRDPDHIVLSEPYELTVQQCYGCHNTTQELSHPVNVFPKPGMVIPPEYPTLPDGRISCMTCHHLHSSDNPFRTLKEHNRDLCIGCHKEMI